MPTPAGRADHDLNSTNGTFVNGQRVKDALLREDDVVTIGNVDLVLANGTLARRSEPAAEPAASRSRHQLVGRARPHAARPNFVLREAGTA